MKTAAILLALFAAAGLNAQGLLNGQPACATSCLTSAISAAGCALTDVSCQCGPTITIIASSAIPCLVTACADNDVQGVINAQTAACGGFVFTASTTPPPSLPSSFTTSATATTTSTSSSSTASQSEGKDGSSTSLSSGASIGVGVGIALGVVAIVGVAWLVFKRRKGARAAGRSERLGSQVDDKYTGDAEYRPELEANQLPVEIGGGYDRRTVLVELDGGHHRWSRRT